MQAVSQIAVGPRLLDFGKVSAASRNTRYLAVTNPSLQSVHIVLAVANLPELKDSEPVSQVTALCPCCAPFNPCFTVFCFACWAVPVLCCAALFDAVGILHAVCVSLCKRVASLLMMQHCQKAKLALACCLAGNLPQAAKSTYAVTITVL